MNHECLKCYTQAFVGAVGANAGGSSDTGDTEPGENGNSEQSCSEVNFGMYCRIQVIILGESSSQSGGHCLCSIKFVAL